MSATVSTPFRGVRISWLITARNLDLARRAAWASTWAALSVSASLVISRAWSRLARLVACSRDRALPMPA